MSILIASIVTLSIIGFVSAVVLFFVAKKFKVEEDPRIDLVEAVLPGANCGGCGYPGCRGFADACVKSDTLDGKLCPVGGQPVMTKVADILGLAAGETTPKVAVVKCSGTCTARPRTSNFDGTKSCAIVTQLYAGETGCSYGCVGYGDCAAACNFDAIHVNPATGLPEVDEEKCTACGACVKACPKGVIELRNKGPKNRRVYVSCINRDKGAMARKACSAACIGCGKCAKACPFEAITVENNVAYIDFEKCRLCRKCVAVCPTSAIHDVNFPTPVPAPEKKAPEVKKVEPVAVNIAAVAEQKPQPAVVEKTQESAPAEKPQEVTIETIAIDKPKSAAVEPEVPKQEATQQEVAKQEVVTEIQPVEETKQEEAAPKITVVEETPQEEIKEEKKPAEKAASENNEPTIPTANDEFDINSLIPDELRVKPREKTKETRPEAATPSAETLKLDF